MACLGIVTIGQSPRHDMVPELRQWLGDAGIIEGGALDGLTLPEVTRLGPDARPGNPESGNPGHSTTGHSTTEDAGLLVTRMRDGTGVQVDAEHIYPLVCRAVRSVEARGADLTLVVCTGEMPPVPHQRALLLAGTLITAGVGAVSAGERLGVICPDPGQETAARARWARVSDDPLTAPASPYAPDSADQVRAAARRLAAAGAQVIVLDCMGYRLSAQRAAADASGLPVLLARAVVARLAAARLDSGRATAPAGRAGA